MRLALRALNKFKRIKKRISSRLRDFRKAQEMRLWSRNQKELFAVLKAEIEEGNQKTLSDCEITVTFSSRYFGSEDNLLDQALLSLAQYTHDKDRLEVLIKVDEDDYLPYFVRIIRRYRYLLPIRCFVSPRGRGYEDIYRFNADLIAKASPGSKVWQGICEGAKFEMAGWDRMLMKTIEASGKYYFVGTQATFEASKVIQGPFDIYKPHEIYHIGAEDYPFVSFKLLKLIERATEGRPRWSCLGATSFSDCFMADLIRLCHDVYGNNIHVQVPSYVHRTGSFNWALDPVRLQKRTLILAEFFNKANREARLQIAQRVHQALEEK